MSDAAPKLPQFPPGQRACEDDSLTKQMDNVLISWCKLKYFNWDTHVLAAMHDAAHKLQNDGQGYSFQRINDRARALERLLQTALEKVETSTELRYEIEMALSELKYSINEATKKSSVTSNAECAAPKTPPLKISIALIENDLLHASLLKLLLERRGYEVTSFTHPSAFEKALDLQRFHIALMELAFPANAMEGIVWLEQLKGRVGNMPIIMLSARTDIVARLRAQRAGANAYLPKPLNFEHLLQKMQLLLKKKTQTECRVLMVDDDIELLAFCKKNLNGFGFKVETLAQPLRLLEIIERFRPDVVVLDYQMPACTGVELGVLLQQDPNFMSLPIIFTAVTPQAVAKLGIAATIGQAFLPKPLDIALLGQTLKQYSAQSRLTPRRLQHATRHPINSQLQNRLSFYMELEALIMRSTALGSQTEEYFLANIAVDKVEHLKSVYHPLLLAQQETAIETFLSTYPFVEGSGCSLGAMNFLILLHDREELGGEVLVNQLQESLRRRQWRTSLQDEALTLSMGVSSLRTLSTLDDALAKTERACARASHAGGNRVEWIQQATPLSPSKKPILSGPIKKALRSRSLKLVYQPIVNLDKEDVWFEALVRLVDESGQTWMPAQFIEWVDVAMEGGNYSLDRFVIEHSLNAMRELSGKAAAGFSIIVKLSPPLTQLERLLPFISNAVTDARLRGTKQIIFSLPETCVTNDIARVKKFIQQLHKLNCGFMLEHVAPSRQSLNALKDLGPLDFIKLSPEWNRRVETDKEIRTALGQLLQVYSKDFKLVACNIEDAKSFANFWELGVRYFQGYFIQHPSETMVATPFEEE